MDELDDHRVVSLIYNMSFAIFWMTFCLVVRGENPQKCHSHFLLSALFGRVETLNQNLQTTDL